MYRLFLLLTALVCFCSACARKEYFQKTALVSPLPGDSTKVRAGLHYKKGFFHHIWWGKHYRPVWAATVRLPVLDLSKQYGGLTPDKLGGGFQSTSLTLKDKQGKQYALRSVDKDPHEILPKGLRKTVLSNLLRDQTSAGHPYGAVVVSSLAEGVQLKQSHPSFFYIPKDVKGLGEHTPDFEDRVFLLEEKLEGTQALGNQFKKAANLVDSEDFLKNRFSQHAHLPDQLTFANARLFDVLIGDWDRHEGQWQWAIYDTSAVKYYYPVPKDRDQAFFKFDDGLIPWLFTRRWAPLSKMKTFHTEVNSVRGYLQNARFIDERCLNEVTAEQWQQTAVLLQQKLTDSVIKTSVAALPPAAYELTGQEITQKLISRREQLPELAQEMYLLLAKDVQVAGTDLKEKFVIERQPNGDTRVMMLQLPANEAEKPLLVYDRLFKKTETRSIALYGLADEDEFIISGEGNKGITVSIYPGMGEDDVKDSSSVQGWGKKTRVYDTKRGVTAEKGKETRLIKKRSVKVHAYDREGL